MKRAIMLASGAALAMALATPSLAEDRGELIFEDIVETKYVSAISERVIPTEKGKAKDGDPDVIKKTKKHYSTYETGTRVWEKSSGFCYMEKRTLEGVANLAGVQLPSIRSKYGSADCETREFMDGSNFPPS